MHRESVTFVVYIQKNDIFVVTNLQFMNFWENNFQIWFSITHRYILWSQFVILNVNVLGKIHKLFSIKRIFVLKVTSFS